MHEVLLALGAGIVVGIVFSLLRLPIPAPPVFSAVVGIFGVYFGGEIYQWIVQNWMTK